jgi:hypothetical protein
MDTGERKVAAALASREIVLSVHEKRGLDEVLL